jgi:Protein of unknown function (DUF2815)
MDTTILLTNVRLSYPTLFTAKEIQGSTKAKYSAAFILDKKKDVAQIKKLQEVIENILKENKIKVDPDKRCLKDGASKPDSYGDDVFFINASSDRRPQVVDRDRSPITESDDRVYGGCYVNAVINLWPQNNDFGKRVNASLEVVQFVKDGEPFGRKPVDVSTALPDLSGTVDSGDGLD